MAFTGKLGTSDSRLGNIVLGNPGYAGTSLNEAISGDGNAAVTLTVTTTIPLSLTIAGNSATTILGGLPYSKIVNIDGLSAIDQLLGSSVINTLTIDGLAATTQVGTEGIVVSLTIDGLAAATQILVVIEGAALTIAGQSATTQDALKIILKTLTVSGYAAFFSPGGIVLFNNFAIEGYSVCDILPGSGYFPTYSIDGLADITLIESYIKQLAITIDGFSEAALDSQYVANILQSIAGVSALVIVNTGEWYNSISVACKGEVYTENIYDVLYVSAAVAGFNIAFLLQQNPSRGAQGVAGVGVSSQCVFARSVVQTLALTQTAIQKAAAKFVSQTFALTQTASGQKVHTESIEDSLALTATADAWRPTNTGLTLTHTAQATRVRSVSVVQTLGLSQSVARNQTILRSVVHTLTFNTPNLRRLHGRFNVEVPPAYGILVPTKCMVVLGVPSKTIILPCPLFNDSASFQGTLDLKRSMIGSTYTVIKNTTLQRLKYDFWLWTNKYLELRAFLLAHSAETITLQNWKGETWLVTLSNNPVQLTAEERFQPKGERYSVTLEFEGIRIGGQI